MSLEIYLLLAFFLFVVGAMTVLTRKHYISLLIGIELMLNAANLNLIAFSRYLVPAGAEAYIFALLIIFLAAVEVSVGLAMVLNLYRSSSQMETDALKELNG